MLQEDKKQQIMLKQIEIVKLEEGAHKKELYIKNRSNEEYDPNIHQFESELKEEQGKLEEVNNRLAQWTAKQKELLITIKNLKRNYKNAVKEKNAYLKHQLKDINNEKKAKIKVFRSEIKRLEKELKIITSV